jgi:hypothetical protein
MAISLLFAGGEVGLRGLKQLTKRKKGAGLVSAVACPLETKHKEYGKTIHKAKNCGVLYNALKQGRGAC